YYEVYKENYNVFRIIYDYDSLNDEEKKNDRSLAEQNVGKAVNDYIIKIWGEDINNFIEFIQECDKKKIEVIYYAGNHDCLLSHHYNHFCIGIEILKKIKRGSKNLHFPSDLGLIKLNEDLYLIGVHNIKNSSYEYPDIKPLVESLCTIESPEKIIFVSHTPSKNKFFNAGSGDISLLKKKFKFKYHFHGHCKDYNKEYDDYGTPTRSVHF
ncbi:hypothetical protein ACFL0W_01450, partial [Nanoarchaeota archaeon]